MDLKLKKLKNILKKQIAVNQFNSYLLFYFLNKNRTDTKLPKRKKGKTEPTQNYPKGGVLWNRLP